MTQPIVTEMSAADEEPPSSGSDIEIELIVDPIVQQTVASFLSTQLVHQAVRLAAVSRGFSAGSIGVRITDDITIRQLNAKYLGHDYATDVISFGYTADPPTIEGELVVSVDTAAREAISASESAGQPWTTEQELVLYVVHGVLHIAAMDDHEPADRAAMRAAEEAVFLELGIPAITRCGADKNPSEQNSSEQNPGKQKPSSKAGDQS